MIRGFLNIYPNRSKLVRMIFRIRELTVQTVVQEVCRAKYQQRDSISVSPKQRGVLFAVTVSIAHAAILSRRGKN